VSRPWWRAVSAVATALAGVLTLASSLSPNLPERQRLLEAFEPAGVATAAHVVGVAAGLFLLWTSWGVLRGRRPTIRAAVAVLGALVVVHAAKGLDYEEALIALGVAAVLRTGLRAAAREREPSRAAAALLIAVVAVAGAYSVLLSAYMVSGARPQLGTALVRAAGALVDQDAARLGDVARVALNVCIALGLVSVVMALRALLAPARPQDGHDAGEHARAATIVGRYGHDSIAPFILRADKAFFFAHGGVVAYRTLRETAVVSGDPVGPPGSAPFILAAFLVFAEARGWDVVVVSARDEHLRAYREVGLRTMRIGSEAVVDPAAFSLAGRAGRTARKAVHRVAKHGWTVELVPAARLDRRLAGEVDAVQRAWGRRHRRLTGFAMASDRLWGAPEDADDLYALARNPAGELRAFQRYVRHGAGLSLDAMRRLDDEPNGISDALVVAVLEHARDTGCREVSLNFAGFAHLMAADTLERRSQRLARWALRRMHRRFQLERLVRFTAKFSPEQRARHLVYTRQTRLPLAALRVMQAEAYVKPPPPSPRRDAWRPLAAPTARDRARGRLPA
jgi:lysyl-tRNA synthetase class 2